MIGNVSGKDLDEFTHLKSMYWDIERVMKNRAKFTLDQK